MPTPILPLCICADPLCIVPYGFCHCRCGEKTELSPVTVRKAGWIKGKPRRYVFNHHGRKRPEIEDAMPFKIDGVYCRLIPLTQGQYAIIDASDYEWLMQWKWFAVWNPCTRSYYASRNQSTGNGQQINVRMHREILGLKYGDPEIGEHANCVTLDCRRENLRPATHAQNMQNMRLVQRNKTGHKNVQLFADGIHYVAHFRANGKEIYVGFFSSKNAAIAAVDEKRKQHLGEFARPK